MKYIRFFETIGLADINSVGGKNASLGEMIAHLSAQGIRVPTGFAIIADAYWYYVAYNKYEEKIDTLMHRLTDIKNIALLQKIGKEIRQLFLDGSIPDDLAQEIQEAYAILSQKYGQKNADVAVRSSATAEDLPTASFAGQQETYLNISGNDSLLQAYKKCLASLFTDRAIVYRVEQGFDFHKVALSVGVQKMIRSDKAVSGVAFSLDTDTGFADVVTIESSYGLGESIVQGLVNPDEFIVYKKTLKQGFKPLLKKICGDKKTKLIYATKKNALTKTVTVSNKERMQYSLSDDEIVELAQCVMRIEDHYSALKKKWSPMDIEWAKDGIDGHLYIIQARPETVYANKKRQIFLRYALTQQVSKKDIIVEGLSIGQKIVSGKARIIINPHDITQVHDGDIVVTQMTDPDWVPIMKRAGGIITDRGGRTCHAAIVSRELGIAALVGTKNATQYIKNGAEITIDCSSGAQGYVYAGKVPFDVQEISYDMLGKAPVSVLVNIGDPDSAFQASFLPVEGVGLARIEFIISNTIKIHPMALVHFDDIKDKKIKKQIETITTGYGKKTDFFVEKLAQGIGTIAAAFYPRQVIVRFSDFKSNEYRNLIGGALFEGQEENPMIGLRGSSRYYNERYKEAFALECAALRYVHAFMGLKNIKAMLPFVRSLNEAQKVCNELEKNGLVRGEDGFELIMMCEVPSNALLIEDFASFFDGFSIGSNDLTQLVLGVDRDSGILAPLFDERDEAVKKMMAMAIKGAKKRNRPIGICGQAPSDYPEIASFLIKEGVSSISLNIDAVIPFLVSFKK